MLYNDDEIREDEKRFQENLKAVRSLTEKEKQILTEQMDKLLDGLQLLTSKPNLTEAEMAMLEKLKEKIPPIAEKINAMKATLDESVIRQSNAYYQHIKKLAEEGNEDAKKIYEDLKPAYQAMLKEQLGEN